MGFFSGLFSSDDALPPRTPPAIGERIQNILGIKQLESMPAQAARAFQLASDPKARGADFVEVIESDEVLSARIIRVANSVYFFRGTPANDIEKAVANIGLDELRCLLSATMLRSLLSAMHPIREQIWSNAVGTAIACRTLSRFDQNTNSGEAFLCGLLSDVGKLLMIRKGGPLYEKVTNLVATDAISFVEAEEKVFELNHVEVGKWLAEQWNFPAIALRTLTEHHNPIPKLSKLDWTPTYLVQLGDLVAHASGIGHPPHLRSFAKRCKEELKDLAPRFQLKSEDLDKICNEFIDQFEKDFGMYHLER
jgi:HD-like signal output (HDOD) protein